jgi:hypothetical protein
MGWKVFAIFAAEEPGYFGTQPLHDPERAEQIREQLGLSGYEYAGPSEFDAAMYPDKRSLFIGAYPRGVILCDPDLPACFFDAWSISGSKGKTADFQQFKSSLLKLYPGGQVLAVVLHSVVNLWGYCLFSEGQLIRCAAGASDDGLIADHGMPLPEEASVLGNCPINEIDEEGYGEDLVFDVTARFLGKRLDAFEQTNLQMSEYRRTPGGAASFLRKLFGRA